MNASSYTNAAILVLACCLGVYSPGSSAQSTGVSSATIRTCNLVGNITLTTAGVPVQLTVGCVDKTTQSTPGQDQSSLVGATIVGVPGVVNAASVNAPYGASGWANTTGTTTLAGDEGAAAVNMAQDGVQSSDVAGALTCTNTSAAPSAVSCGAHASIGQLSIQGQSVAIPPQPIPLNYTIPVSNLVLQVQVAGGQVVNIATNGALVLNKTVVSGVGTSQLSIEHAPISISLTGSTMVPGLGVIAIDVQIDDDTGVQIYQDGISYSLADITTI